MRLRYQIKSIFKIPIIATPAAEPIIKTEPPVPAQYAGTAKTSHQLDKSQLLLASFDTSALHLQLMGHYQQLKRVNL